jgi:hypothetical protein
MNESPGTPGVPDVADPAAPGADVPPASGPGVGYADEPPRRRRHGGRRHRSAVPGASGTGPAASALVPVGSGGASGPSAATVAPRIRLERPGIDLPIVGWDGMFLPLWDAQVGDTVTLDLVAGGQATYRVVEVLPRVPWNADHYLDPTPNEILTLQTSTSSYATAPRFVVIAEPVT